MLLPMAVLAACCAGLGVAPLLAAPLLQDAAGVWAGAVALPAVESLAPLRAIGLANCGLIALAALVLLAVTGLRRRRPALRACTWDCGFAAPAPRMQYTASSFAQMLVGLMAFVLRPRAHRPHLHGPFPHHVSFKSHVDDLVLDGWLMPVLRTAARWLARLRVLQYGSSQLYVLYVLIVLVLLLLGAFPVHQVLLRVLAR
jgi:hydrogenase-4 component B